MSDHLVLYVDRLITPATLQSMQGAQVPEPSGESSCVNTAVPSGSTSGDKKEEEHEVSDEEEPLLQTVECRICQEEDHMKNLETPCACSGSLKPYQSGYTAPPPPPPSDDATIDIRQVQSLCMLPLPGEGWTISGAPVNLHDPRLLAMAAAERRFLEAEYDEYSTTNASGAAFCRSAALIVSDNNHIYINTKYLCITSREKMLKMRKKKVERLFQSTATLYGREESIVTAFHFDKCHMQSDFLASGCWFSTAVLHYGLGHQHLAASKAKGGSSDAGSDGSCICATISTKEGSAVHNSTRSGSDDSPSGAGSIIRVWVLILLICFGFLAVQPEKVSGLRSIDLVLRWDKEHGLVPKHARILKAVAMEELNTEKKSAPSPPTFDPNRSSKRRVRRGSDPIHNRC
ncbi:hypothetical protein HHK36_015344 [Tetracentron sinense]|uniref:RING-CH-type domain-containing protein n=1 Tax=Tetracentron sinense TaxID=13715 RepID=A0A835DDJ6_TETSI|nr:hypothetical protein HHK36_015344 [Tetracentron sinense]